MTDRPSPDGLLARLRRQEEPEEVVVADDAAMVAEEAAERPAAAPAAPPPAPPAEHHHEHQDRGAVPWAATRPGGMFADLLGPVTTAGPIFTPEEFHP